MAFIKETSEGMITKKEYSTLREAEDELIRLTQLRTYCFFMIESVDHNYTETGNFSHYTVSFY